MEIWGELKRIIHTPPQIFLNVMELETLPLIIYD